MNKIAIYSYKCIFAPLSFALTSTLAFADNTTLGTDAGANLIGSAEGNTLVGQSAGNAMTYSDYNTFIGDQTGMANTGNDNVFIGYQSGLVNINCFDNTFVGYQSGVANCSATSGSDNSFFGYQSGFMNTEGNDNTFIGFLSGYENTTGSENTFFGYHAGYGLSTADKNTGVGYRTMRDGTTTAYGNAVMGYYVGYDLTSGSHNTQLGYDIYQLDEGNFNTTVGFQAAYNTEQGDYNTFIGAYAGYQNDAVSAVQDNRNTAFGAGAYYNNRQGSDNLYIGVDSDVWGTGTNRSVSVGYGAEGEDSGGVAIGAYSASVADDSIALGTSTDVLNEDAIGIGLNSDSYSNKTVTIGGVSTLSWDAALDITNSLGDDAYRFSNLISASVNSQADSNASVSWILNADSAEDDGDSWQVEVSEDGDFIFANDISGSQVAKLTLTGDGDLSVGGELYLNSDRRLKTNILPIKNALELSNNIQAVRYHFIEEENTVPSHLGLIAQQVEAIVPEMVKTDENGRKTVNYIALVPILVESIKGLDKQNKTNRDLLKELKARKAKLENLVSASHSNSLNLIAKKEAFTHEGL